MTRRVPCLAAALVWATAAGASDPAETLRAASARMGEAAAGLEAAQAGDKRAASRVEALGAAITDYAGALEALRAGVNEAGAREREIALDHAGRRAEIARLLATLQAVRTPAPRAPLHPEGPLGAARAAGMLARLTPALRDRVDALARELGELATARRLRQQGGADLAGGLARLDAARTDLRAAIAAVVPEPEASDPVVTMMARNSDTLTALAAALGGPGVPGGRPEDNRAPGSLLWPVDGPIVRGFEAPDAAGVRRPGIVLGAPPLSLVTAPANGLVRYAGPFLDYGYVVVLEPEPAMLVVLAGLAQLQVRTGAAVRRGDLLGLLGGRALNVEEYVMEPEAGTGAGASETLYIEIRHGKGPVDPAPWFSRRNG